jgi:hypothetical protein
MLGVIGDITLAMVGVDGVVGVGVVAADEVAVTISAVALTEEGGVSTKRAGSLASIKGSGGFVLAVEMVEGGLAAGFWNAVVVVVEAGATAGDLLPDASLLKICPTGVFLRKAGEGACCEVLLGENESRAALVLPIDCLRKGDEAMVGVVGEDMPLMLLLLPRLEILLTLLIEAR